MDARGLVVQSIEHSLPFGLYHRDELFGFARVLTETFASKR